MSLGVEVEGDVNLEGGEEVDEGREAELAFGAADEVGTVDAQIGHAIVEEVGQEAGGREVGVAGGDLMGYGRLPVGVDGDGHDGECKWVRGFRRPRNRRSSERRVMPA